MLLYQYACACGQPVISGLPLQHAQGALLLSCELRRLRFSRCLSRWWCLNRCLNRCRLNRLWLALWSSRLSRHVLLSFVFAPGACPAVSVPVPPAQRVAQRAPLAPLAPPPLAPAPLVRSAPSFLIICGQDTTRRTKTTREAGRRCRPGRSGGSACASG